MADISNVERKNNLLVEYHDNYIKKLFLFCIGVCVLSLLHPLALFLFIFIFLVPKSDKIILAGAQGEIKALEALKELSDDYLVFTQVPIPVPDKDFCYIADYIILTSKTILIIEVKNINGNLNGTDADHEWEVQKVGRGGTKYSTSIKNPIRQVRKHAYAFSQICRKNGIKSWVGTIALFTHYLCTLDIKNETNTKTSFVSNLKKNIEEIEKEAMNKKFQPVDIIKVTGIIDELKDQYKK